MSLSLTPSKRQHNQNSKESNGKKFQKTSLDSPKEPRKSLPGGDVFRVLCPSAKIERIIGEGENVISQIRQETGAKVRVDGPVPECDERVIFIMGPDREAQNSEEFSKNDNRESESSQSTKEQEDNEDHKEKDINTDKDTRPTALISQTEKGTSSVQKALLLVLDKFIEDERETEEANKESNGSGIVTFRLLVLSSQVGCLLGKGGSVIKEMSSKSGAQIRILPRDNLPRCASSSDDIVQITGLGDAVKKAIKCVSDQIMENASGDQDLFPSNSSGPSINSHKNSIPRSESQSARSFPYRGAPLGGGFRIEADFHSNGPPFPKFHENLMPSQIDAPDIVTFRLLCPDERVGNIIGKGGAIIKALHRETRCDIKVLEGTSAGEERIIIVSGPAHPDDKISVVQDAILRIQNRIAKAKPDGKDKGATAKLLVPSHQIGCLLGKGGSVIAEMRKFTGANIRILGKDQQPKSASDDEVVQINGELEVVQEAILQVTTRLLRHFFRDAFPSIIHPSNSAFSDRAPPFAAFMGRHELSPPMFPKFGPPFRTFDSIGAPPMHGDFHPHDDHPPFMHDVNRHGIPEGPWRPQTTIEGGPLGLLEYGGRGLQERQMSGFGGGSQPAIITNTTVEVVVPSAIVPSIYGEGGGCLREIRQISDAKIIIQDPKPGIPETLIIISGTPEQTHAAQSLIQAFVMLENETS